MPRKQKGKAARASKFPWIPLKGYALWEQDEIGATKQVQGMFVQFNKLGPAQFPRILLLPETTALLCSERLCRFPFLSDGTDYFPAEWHPQANPKVKAFLLKHFTVDLRNCHEETYEESRTVYRLVP